MATIGAPPTTKSIFQFPPNFPNGTVSDAWIAWFQSVQANTYNYPPPVAGYALGWDSLGNIVNVPNTGADQYATLADTTLATNGAGRIGYNPVVVYDPNTVGSRLNDIGTAAAGKGASLVGFGNGTVYDALYSTVIGNGVTDVSAELAAANALGFPIRIKGVCVCVGVTITVPILDTINQIFSNSSTVTINNGLPVRPEWFGNGQGNINLAVNALPAPGGVIMLRDAVYPPQNHVYGVGAALGTSWGKAHVEIVGEKMPVLAPDCKSLTGGTIIQGRICVYADDFEIVNVGVDCGFNVCATYNAGSDAAPWNEALVCTYPDDTTKNASTYKRGLMLHNVIGLCNSPATIGHAVIVAEGYYGVRATGKTVGCYGVHGVVIKAIDVNVDSVEAYCNNMDGFIVKSDVIASQISSKVRVGTLYVDANGPQGSTPYIKALVGTGFIINAISNNIDAILIGKAYILGYPVSVQANIDTDNSIIQNVTIDELLTDNYGISGATHGLRIVNQALRYCDGWIIGKWTAQNCAAAARITLTRNTDGIQIGELLVVNSSDVAIENFGSGTLQIGSLSVNNIATAVYRFGDTAKAVIGTLYRKTGCLLYTNTAGSVFAGNGLIPTFSANWSQVAAQDIFAVELLGGQVVLRGMVTPAAGATTTVCNLPPWARPTYGKRFMVQGTSTAPAQSSVPVYVSANGDVTINEFAGGTANCSSWLSFDGMSWALPGQD